MNSFVFIFLIFLALLALIFVLVELLSKPSLKHIFFGLISVILALMVATLLSDPVSKLPGMLGQYLPITLSVVFGIGGLILYRKFMPLVDEWGTGFIEILRHFVPFIVPAGQEPAQCGEVIIDSSAIIDSRIIDITRLGFLPQKVVVPRFIVRELQNIADSKDHDRREKGKRGLANVEKLKRLVAGRFELATDKIDEAQVDHQLVAIAKSRGASLVTTDYNLNKVAGAEGVLVLNVNELAQSLRPQLLPGESFQVKLVHVGKDKTQGVGYLEDGTMIVVEGAGKLLGKEVDIKISRALQTAAGKMYFAKVHNG